MYKRQVVDGESATVGIDLHAKTGIRCCSGDAQQWRNQPKREWDKYTFGCYVFWIMDDEDVYKRQFLQSLHIRM